MRLVTDGKLFAIQKGWLFKRYLGLGSMKLWWSLEDSYEHCWDCETRVRMVYDFLDRKRRIKVVD